MTVHIGAGQANEVGDIHEACGPVNPSETQMDLHNNNVGISLGAALGGGGGVGTCSAGCAGAVNSGITINSPPGAVTSLTTHAVKPNLVLCSGAVV